MRSYRKNMFKKRKRKGKHGRRNYSSNKDAEDTDVMVGKGEPTAAPAVSVPPGNRRGPKRDRLDKTRNEFTTSKKIKSVSAESTDRSSIVPSISSDRTASSALDHRANATAVDETDTALDRDATAILTRNIEVNRTGEADDTSKYRGQTGYKNYVKKDMSAIGMNKHKGTQGPLRRPQFFRSTVRVDYQPDICKDYKETGYCGYGDTCIYLHDRGDYKKGWQIEKEWEIAKKRDERRRRGEDVGDDEDDKGKTDKEEDDLPFACLICRKEFTLEEGVVVTSCTHYFHRNCAIRRFQSGKRKCFVCKKTTGGIFNTAKNLEDRLRSKVAARGAIAPAGKGGDWARPV